MLQRKRTVQGVHVEALSLIIGLPKFVLQPRSVHQTKVSHQTVTQRMIYVVALGQQSVCEHTAKAGLLCPPADFGRKPAVGRATK
jgi:hypothetical protein